MNTINKWEQSKYFLLVVSYVNSICEVVKIIQLHHTHSHCVNNSFADSLSTVPKEKNSTKIISFPMDIQRSFGDSNIFDLILYFYSKCFFFLGYFYFINYFTDGTLIRL